MGSHRLLSDQASIFYLDNIEECIRYQVNVNNIFNSSDETTKELYEWTRSVLNNCENVWATHVSGILFASLISLSHFTQNSTYLHWKQATGLKNINLFGLIG
jgi:hypothetical protein